MSAHSFMYDLLSFCTTVLFTLLLSKHTCISSSIHTAFYQKHLFHFWAFICCMADVKVCSSHSFLLCIFNSYCDPVYTNFTGHRTSSESFSGSGSTSRLDPFGTLCLWSHLHVGAVLVVACWKAGSEFAVWIAAVILMSDRGATEAELRMTSPHLLSFHFPLIDCYSLPSKSRPPRPSALSNSRFRNHSSSIKAFKILSSGVLVCTSAPAAFFFSQ